MIFKFKIGCGIGLIVIFPSRAGHFALLIESRLFARSEVPCRSMMNWCVCVLVWRSQLHRNQSCYGSESFSKIWETKKNIEQSIILMFFWSKIFKLRLETINLISKQNPNFKISRYFRKPTSDHFRAQL